MANVVIRNVRRADVAAIAAIYDESVETGTASYELEPPGAAEMGRRMAALVEHGFPYIVAEDEAGTLLGYAYAGPYRPRPAYRFVVENSIYLAEAARGRGVGRALLERLIQVSEAAGFRQMIAVIGGADHHASIRLHAACGFRTIGVFEGSGYKFGRWLDTVFMQRALGEGNLTTPTERR